MRASQVRRLAVWWRSFRLGRTGGTGRGGPVVHVWYREAGIRLRTKRVLAAPGIERLRQFARLEELRGEPRLLVHPRCRAFIAECGGGPHPVPGMGVWRRKVDRSGNTIGPPMEENNHACKALT